MTSKNRIVAISESPDPQLATLFHQLASDLGGGFKVLLGTQAKNPAHLAGYSFSQVDERGPIDIGRVLRHQGVGQQCSVLFDAITPAFSRTAAIAAKMLGARLLYRRPISGLCETAHDNWATRLRDRISLSLFDCFLATGTHEWEYIEQVVRKPLIVFSPHFGNPTALAKQVSMYSAVRRDSRDQLGIELSDFVVASFGPFVPDSKHTLLIEAAHWIENRCEAHVKNSRELSIRLLLAGDGPARAKLHTQIRDRNWKRQPIDGGGGSERITLGRLLCAADAFVVLSATQPSAVINLCDAQLLGNVCLANKALTASQDLIVEGRNGTVIDPLSPQAIAHGLIDLVAIRERADHIDLNRELSQTFSPVTASRGIIAAAKLGSTGALTTRPPGLPQ